MQKNIPLSWFLILIIVTIGIAIIFAYVWSKPAQAPKVLETPENEDTTINRILPTPSDRPQIKTSPQ